MSPRARPFQWTAPLGLQVLVLVFASVAFAQALALVIIVASPPPRPSPILLDDLVAAFQGGELTTTNGRRLVRELLPLGAPAPVQLSGEPFLEMRREALARRLGAAPSSVVLNEARPTVFERLLTDGIGVPGGPPPGDRPRPLPSEGWGPPPGGPLSGASPPPDRAGQPSDVAWGRSPAPHGPWTMPFGGPHGPVMFDRFTAALTRPDGRVVVIRSSDAWRTAWQLGVVAWLIGAGIVMAPVCLWFARRITAPLDDFAAAAQRLGRDPAAAPMPVAGPREIRRAALAFNDMQLRVRRYVEDRTGMIGAISHDLRTPLARIGFKLESKTPDKASIRSDLMQMESMISDVLAFLRDIAEPRTRERINLLSLVETIIDDIELLNAPVTLAQAADPIVEGDVQALQRALGNLLQNAVKYGGRAEVSVKVLGAEALVDIEDDGQGLSPVEREAVFKPFYRTDSARRLDGSGVGLGLAVSRSIAHAHGGDIVLDVRSRGLVATLKLPIAGPIQ